LLKSSFVVPIRWDGIEKGKRIKENCFESGVWRVESGEWSVKSLHTKFSVK